MKKIIFLSLSLIFALILINNINVKAETLIYDNISTSNYKLLVLTDDLNIKYINEYSYDVYIDNSYYGNFHKDDKILIPDNSNITIYIPQSNIKTDISNIWDTGKTNFYIAVMYLISGFILIAFLIFIFKKFWR